MGFDKLPAGQMANIAVMPWRGHGQEDAIVVRKGWIDMGGLRGSVYKTYTDEEAKQGPIKIDRFEVPDPTKCVNLKVADYSLLDEDGIIGIGNNVTSSTVLIGKTTPCILKKMPSTTRGGYKFFSLSNLKKNQEW